MKLIVKRPRALALARPVQAALVCIRADGAEVLVMAGSGRSNRLARTRAKERARSPYGRPLTLK